MVYKKNWEFGNIENSIIMHYRVTFDSDFVAVRKC